MAMLKWIASAFALLFAPGAAVAQALEAGGPGGAPYSIDCRSGEFVNAFRTRQGDMLDALVAYCKGVDRRSGQVTSGWDPDVEVGGRDQQLNPGVINGSSVALSASGIGIALRVSRSIATATASAVACASPVSSFTIQCTQL